MRVLSVGHVVGIFTPLDRLWSVDVGLFVIVGSNRLRTWLILVGLGLALGLTLEHVHHSHVRF